MESSTRTEEEACEAAAQAIAARRAEYTAGLRALADVVDENPEAQLPWDGTGSPLAIYLLSGPDPRAEMAATARIFKAAGVKWQKSVRDDGDGTGVFQLTGSLHGLRLQLTAYREAVCERVVTGHREVTEKVKDPAKLAEVPEIEVTRTVEDVTWECHSILKPGADESAPVQDTEAA